MSSTLLNFLPEFGKYIKMSSWLLVFVGLYTVLVLVYKVLALLSENFLEMGKRLYIQSLIFIFSFSIWWFLLDLPIFQYQIIMVQIAWGAIIFSGAVIILDLINLLFFEVYARKARGVRVPHIITNLTRSLYIIGIFLVVLASVMHVDIKPFLTGSAILTAIIGLALQDTLGNLFSGLALHTSRPFDLGQWIKFGDTEGVVAKIDWRATTIRTREEDYVTIPNSSIAKLDVVNFSAPTIVHAQSVSVGVRYDYPPNKIRNILLDAAYSTDGVIKSMKPDIYLEQYADFSINYRMRYYIDDYARALIIRSSVMEKIWYLFKRNAVEIPYPIRDIYMKKGEFKADWDELLKLLASVDFLADLNSDEIIDVASRLKQVIYGAGEEIIRQGDMGDTFYIIRSGKVAVYVSDEKGGEFLLNELSPGSFFGEISVLTGEPRTATVRALVDTELMVLNKYDFEILLRKYSNMDLHISEKIAARQKHTYEAMEDSQEVGGTESVKKSRDHIESLTKNILHKIRNFFSI